MRKVLLPLAFILFAIIANAQTTSIPDANFEQQLTDLGIDSDGIINVSNFNSGVYLLKVETENFNIIKRIIIK